MTAAVLLLRGAATPASVSSIPLVSLLFLFSLPYAYLLFWSLFSPSTFCSFFFSFLPSLCSLLSPFLCCFVAVSGGQVCCGGGEQARWLRVLFFFYFSVLFWVSPLLMILSPLSLSFSFLFFLSSSSSVLPCFFFVFVPLSLGLPVNISPVFSFYGFGPFSSLFLFLSEKLLLPSFRSLLSLSKKTVGLSLSRFPSSFFFKTKSFKLSLFSLFLFLPFFCPALPLYL